MKQVNQRMQQRKRMLSFAVCSLLFSTTAFAQPTTYGTGAGLGGNVTNSYYGANSGMSNVSGQENTFVGYEAGRNTTGDQNTFVGTWSGLGNTSGYLNTFLGDVAGLSNTTGHSNTFLGRSAGSGNTSGNNNVYVGRATGYQSTGSGNTFVGTEAGPATTTGSNNTLLGYQSTVLNNPTNATAIGYGAFVTASNSVILGNNSASVGIGVTAPVKKLTITSGTTNDGIRITQSTYGYAGVELFNLTSTGKNWGLLAMGDGNFQGPGSFAIYNFTAARGDLTVDGTSGDVTINGFGSGGYKLNVNGTVRATGGYFTSDKRFKKNIEQLTTPLQLIQQLQGVKYSFRDDVYLPQAEGSTGKPQLMDFPKGTQIGLIAQDVEKVLPEVVNTGSDGYKGVAYQNIVPLLIEGIKEQQGQLADMSKKIEELQTALNNLQQCCGQSLNNKNIPGIKPALEQNIPNPLNNSTIIRYNTGSGANAMLQFSNMEGRVVLSKKLQADAGQAEVNTENWPAGIYTYSLIVDGQMTDTKKMIIAR